MAFAYSGGSHAFRAPKGLRHNHNFDILVVVQSRDWRRHRVVALHDEDPVVRESQNGLSPLIDRSIVLERWHSPLLTRVEPPPHIVQQGPFRILASGGTGPIHPSLHGLRGYALSLASCQLYELWHVKPRRPGLAWLLVSTVDPVDGNHFSLRVRLRLVLKGVLRVLTQLFNLLEGFFLQVSERSSTCSATSRGRHAPASVHSRGDTA